MNIKENYQQYVSRYASEVAALKRKNTGFITGELLAFGGILALLICYFAMDGGTQNYLLGAVLYTGTVFGIIRTKWLLVPLFGLPFLYHIFV